MISNEDIGSLNSSYEIINEHCEEDAWVYLLNNLSKSLPFKTVSLLFIFLYLVYFSVFLSLFLFQYFV